MLKQIRIPLYKQIQDYIIDHIRHNKWLPNERIPSENELARQFKVSRITAKNALNALIQDGFIYRIQGKGSFVAPDAGQPILYQPEPMQRDKYVAYLMPRLDNLFTANLLNGIEDVLSQNGYHLLFCKTHDSQDMEKALLRQMSQQKVDGIIIHPVHGETYNEEILKLVLNHFPVVVVDRYLKGIDTNCVCSDNVAGTYEAVKRLIELEHTHIGFVSTYFQGTSSIEDRLYGYEMALVENQFPIDHRFRLVHLDNKQVNSVFEHGGADPESKQMINAFLKQNDELTAVIAANSAVGLTVLEAAEEMGICVPDDLSVIFLDDFELSSFSRIPPTCLSQQEKIIGQEAARMLLSIMANPKQDRIKKTMPTKLIERKSTSKAPTHQESK
jgi:GntR family transcriptional regulator of arabinose operon